MIIDDLYIAIRDRLLLTPSLGIKTIDWFNGQPDEWENGTGKMDPLKLPCVLVRYDQPQWKPRGRKHYEAEGVIYLDIVQRVVDEPLGSHRRAEKVQKRRDSYTIVEAIGKRLVGMRGVGYGTFGLIGMEQDHNYSKLRVDTIAFRSLLCTDMDAMTYTSHEVPALVIDANPAMPVQGAVARVRNTNDTQTIAEIQEGEDYPLPQVAVPYVQADGTLAEFYGSILNLVSGFLRLVLPGGGAPPVPRFTVYEADGVTVHAYRDILSPTFTLPGGGGTPLDGINDEEPYGSYIINDE